VLFPDLRDLIKLKTVVGASGLLHERTGNRTQGDYASLFHGLGVEFETVRPYVIGDDVRYIDWRVTARIGKPQVKTFRAECDRNVLIVVDANAYMRFGTRGTFKSIQTAKTAAILCWKSLQQQDRVGGIVFGDIDKGMQYFKSSKNSTTILKMLKLLCSNKINVHDQVATSAALNHVAQIATPQSLVFIISDFSMDDMTQIERALLALRKKCTVILLPVCDPSDSDIPAIGSLIVASGTQNAVINTNDRLARNKYNAAWNVYKHNLAQLGKKIKAPLLWVDTIKDPVKSLFGISGAGAWKT
jgi:Uncharacterized conserved protein (some members contain a von Willebrand factor type A (vWA) domain)